MSSRLCSLCNSAYDSVLPESEHVSPGHNTRKPHHQSKKALEQAAEQGCYVCGNIRRSNSWQNVTDKCLFWAQSLPWESFIIQADLSDTSIRQNESDKLDGFCAGFPIMIGDIFWAFDVIGSTEAQQYIEDRGLIPPRVQSPKFLELPCRWLAECMANHKSCAQPKHGFRPTRLIEIVGSASEGVRLVVPSEDTIQGSYATLSHCWGKGTTIKLLQGNLASHRLKIQEADLPTSYLEAIYVCRRLGLRYIWIDSLCIVQDSEDDWLHEALSMKDVYENSVLNIAATAAADASQASFLNRDPSLVFPLPVKSREPETPNSFLVYTHMGLDQISESPLLQRAWVCQEMVLPARQLYLTRSQLWWSCREHKACEAFPRRTPTRVVFRGLDNPTWEKIVDLYSACHLTKSLDKLIALSGITQFFQNKMPDDRFMAGMWSSEMPQCLTWVAGTPESAAQCNRPEVYRAPSWSWLSIDGPIEMPTRNRNDRIAELCSIAEIAVLPADQVRAHRLLGGFLRVRGKLTKVSWADMKMAIQCSDRPDHHIEIQTRAHFDESSPDGNQLMISYIDEPTLPECSGSPIVQKRTRVPAASFDGGLYYLPVKCIYSSGSSDIYGILLCSKDSWQVPIYQRVGWVYESAKDAQMFRKHSVDKIVTII